jgi:hypothetical protein
MWSPAASAAAIIGCAKIPREIDRPRAIHSKFSSTPFKGNAAYIGV